MDSLRHLSALVVLLAVPFLASCEIDRDVAREQLANMRIPYTESAFITHARQGDTVAINLFLAAGMDPNVTDEGKTALMLATANGFTAIAGTLLQHGAEIDVQDFSGRTPLMMAAMSGDVDTLKLLIAGGADLEAKDKYGCTALMIAAAEGQTGTVELLLTKRANMKARDKGGRTPLLWAAMKGRTLTAEALIAKGDDMNAQDTNGCTPLILAAWQGYGETAMTLCRNGADPNIKDTKYKRTAAMWARSGNHPQLAEMLAPLEKPSEE